MNSYDQIEISFQPPPFAEILAKYKELDPSLVHLTEKETAILTGQSPKTLEAWRNRGTDLPFLKLGRSIRYRLSDIVEFLERNTFHSTREAKTRDRSVPRTKEGQS